VKLRDIKNGLPSFAKATVELRDEAIDNLVEDGFLKRKEVRRKEGGRPSLRVVVL
jgi:phage portal protein BeeE